MASVVDEGLGRTHLVVARDFAIGHACPYSKEWLIDACGDGLTLPVTRRDLEANRLARKPAWPLGTERESCLVRRRLELG